MKVYTHEEVYESFDRLEELTSELDKEDPRPHDNPEFMETFNELRERILHCEPDFDQDHFRLFMMLALMLQEVEGDVH